MNERFGERQKRDFGDRGFGGGGGYGRPRFVPVKEGEEIDVKIEGVAAKGDGVAKKEGFVIFVPGAQLNDEIRIKITKVARKVAFAEKLGPAQGPIAADTKPEHKRDREEEPQGAADQEEAEQDDADYDESKDSEEF